MRNSTVIDNVCLEELIQDLIFDLNNPINKNKIFVLVEGSDDFSVFKKFFNENVTIWTAGSCFYVKNILLSVTDYKLRLIGIKDSDFDRIKGEELSMTNLFLTDAHDLELMMIDDELISSIVNEETKVFKHHVINEIFTHMDNLSYLRYYNDCHTFYITDQDSSRKTGIKFDGAHIDKFYNGENSIVLDSLLNYIQQFGGNHRIQNFPSKETIEAFKNTYPILNQYNFHNGHDFINCLRIYINALKKALSVDGESKKDIGSDIIAKEIRVSYTFEKFKTTQLFQHIKNWADMNHLAIWN